MENDKEHSDLLEQTRRSWNVATLRHNLQKPAQAAFLASGGSTLFPEEIELLGDLAGKDVVHLLCNAGQDTLSIARLGARVTGVDISDEAIAFAKQLSHGSAIAATFEQADVYEWLAHQQQGGFDVVFMSYGAVPWLRDLDVWARGALSVLRPGGRLVLVEFHPIVWSFDAAFQLVGDEYFARGRVFSQPVGDYVGAAGGLLAPAGFDPAADEFSNPHTAYAFQWTLGEVVTSVARAGLRVESLAEYPFCNGCRVIKGLVDAPGRRLVPPEGIVKLPLMYSLVAFRPNE